MKHFMNSL